jgi:hypothetical protein
MLLATPLDRVQQRALGHDRNGAGTRGADAVSQLLLLPVPAT